MCAGRRRKGSQGSLSTQKQKSSSSINYCKSNRFQLCSIKNLILNVAYIKWGHLANRNKNRTWPHLWHRKNKCCHTCEPSARSNSIFLNTMQYVCIFRQPPVSFLHSSNRTLMHVEEKPSLQPENNASAATLISILLLTCNRQCNSYIKKTSNLIFFSVTIFATNEIFCFILFNTDKRLWGFFCNLDKLCMQKMLSVKKFESLRFL